ncbi:MAG TPA: hypothetical protein EYN54_09575 [Methylococcaceae bacterium]|nr:hypothetical protein [Methylococcaceae bacterium]
MNKIVIAIILIISFVTNKAMSSEFDVQKFLNKTYIKIGAGYKFHEAKFYLPDSTGGTHLIEQPISARIEIGYQLSRKLTVGISHHSQWLSGFPLTNKYEYFKTELFIDYTFSLGDL